MVAIARQPRVAAPVPHPPPGLWIARLIATLIFGLVILVLAVASVATVVEFVRTDLAGIVNGGLSAMLRALCGGH
jgi:hypothetical protein